MVLLRLHFVETKRDGAGGRSNKHVVLGRKVLCVSLNRVKQVLHVLSRPGAYDTEVMDNRGSTSYETNELIGISELLKLTRITPDQQESVQLSAMPFQCN